MVLRFAAPFGISWNPVKRLLLHPQLLACFQGKDNQLRHGTPWLFEAESEDARQVPLTQATSYGDDIFSVFKELVAYNCTSS